MPQALGHWVAPFLPVVLMLTIVIMNHVVTGQRNDKRTASEMERFSAQVIRPVPVPAAENALTL